MNISHLELKGEAQTWVPCVESVEVGSHPR